MVKGRRIYYLMTERRPSSTYAAPTAQHRGLNAPEVNRNKETDVPFPRKWEINRAWNTVSPDDTPDISEQEEVKQPMAECWG